MCPTDALFMKGYEHRWLSSATQVAPFLADRLLPVLRTSAEAAAAQCVDSSDDDDGTVSQRCGFYWRNGTFVDPVETDGTSGAGEELNVFAAVTSLLVSGAAAPATAATSGDSSGTGQDGSSPSGTADGSSPSGTAASDSGAGRSRVEITMSLLVGLTAVFAWVL